MPLVRRAHLAPALSGRRGLVSTAVVGAVTAATLAPTGVADADTRPMPGSFTGYAFDTCDTPSQHAMNDWLKSSRYWAIGIYISGMNRACKTQSHLTPRWVSTQARKGWRLLPLTVGRQASCSPRGYYVGKRISAKPAHDYAEARSQGRSAADTAVAAARHLGIGKHSVLWYDLEYFDMSKKRCRRSALAFTSAWTNGLHRRGFRSGFYSSASSGITLVDNARRAGWPRKQLPGYLWVAEWNGASSLRSSYIGKGGWWPHRRVHQFRGGHTERHGGSAINIDSNFMSTGGGTEPGRKPICHGADVTMRHYPHLQRGAHGPAVKAVQCLLRRAGYFPHKLTGHYRQGTASAVHRFRHHRRGLGTTSKVGRGTWAALLSTGPPLRTKYGSGGREVRRLEGALNAASLAHLKVNGIFGPGDLQAVRHFQHKAGLAGTGVVNKATWRALRHGRLTSPPRHSGGHEWFDVFPDDAIPYNSGAEPRTDR